jgi:hypothetical protein
LNRATVASLLSARTNDPSGSISAAIPINRIPPARVPGRTQLYRHFDADDRLLYVGISISAVIRLYEHRSSSWFYKIAKITIETFDTRQRAVEAERRAIVEERPSYN